METCYGLSPCPNISIVQMIQDSTSSEYGLAVLLNDYVTSALAGDVAEGYNKGATAYIFGSAPASGILHGSGSIASYASDVANRLAGWSMLKIRALPSRDPAIYNPRMRMVAVFGKAREMLDLALSYLLCNFPIRGNTFQVI